MACHSCGIEFFTEEPKQTVGDSVGEKKSCPGLDGMSRCMYTAQGMFVCTNEKDTLSKGVSNVDMWKENTRQDRAFSTASLWEKK